MLLRCRCRMCPVGQTLTAHAGRVPTRRLLYSTGTRTPREKHEARGQLVEGSRCRVFKPISAGRKACAHAQEQLAGPGVIRRVQTRSPTPTIASATVRRLAWLPRRSWAWDFGSERGG